MKIEEIIPGMRVQYVGEITKFTGGLARVLQVGKRQGLTCVYIEPILAPGVELRVPVTCLKKVAWDALWVGQIPIIRGATTDAEFRDLIQGDITKRGPDEI